MSRWSRATDLRELLGLFGDRVPHRKLRLLACAAARSVWPLLADVRTRTAVEVAERYADGQATGTELQPAWAAALDATGDARQPAAPYLADESVDPYIRMSAYLALGATPNVGVWAADPELADGAALKSSYGSEFLDQLPASLLGAVAQAASPWSMTAFPADMTAREAAVRAKEQEMADLFRCLFPNPDLVVSLDERWRTETVRAVGQAIYDEHAFDRLPILADALEDAGCMDVNMLAHARTPGPHARGCWVVDFAVRGEGPSTSALAWSG